MENITNNIKWGATCDLFPNKTGFHLARAIADAHEASTGKRTVVRRVVDYVDQYDGRDREHFSFDIVESELL